MFTKAERKQAKLKIALTGPSGSGKTLSSLLIAKGIGGKVAVIDTESSSASLYADRFDFDCCNIEPPYTTEKYEKAIKAALAAKYDVIIVDSITHQWAAEGGILDRKTKIDMQGGNSYTNWGKMTPEQERFKSLLLNADTHMICTMRSKQDYILQENEKGKQVPKKVGMAPIQREGMEYEFTLVLDMNYQHFAQASKDRTGLFDLEVFKPDEATGKKLIDWLLLAKPQEKKAEIAEEDLSRAPTPNEVMATFALVKEKKKFDQPKAIAWLEEFTGLKSSKEWTLKTIRNIEATLEDVSEFSAMQGSRLE